MRAIDFKEKNSTFTKENCLDLPAYHGEGEIISCWNTTFKDKLKIILGKKIWLHVKGTTQPPIYVSTDFPFKKN